MLEKDIEQKVVDHATSLGALYLKLNVRGQTGWPDRMFIYKGTVLFVEFKLPGEVPEPHQLVIHALLEQHLMSVMVIDDIQQGKEIINVLCNQ